jgi:hypothetical protein
MSMNTWVVIAGIWAMFALCVVLFVRGASPRVDAHSHENAEREDAPDAAGQPSSSSVRESRP